VSKVIHDCQSFREDWIAGSAESISDCQACQSFCEDAKLLLDAVDGATQPTPEFSQEYWDRFDNLLRARLFLENASRRARLYWQWSAVAAVAATIILVVNWGGIRVPQPAGNQAKAEPQMEFVDDHIKGLNPTVVTFLGQSELFLRNVSKIDPSHQEDLQDAQSHATQDLAEIEKQKLRAADFAPVRMALDEYESVLRDIKNVDSDKGIADIQKRIRRSGIIANMMAYQPQLVMVSHVR